MFVWLSLPECDVDALAASALKHGVAVVPSSVFYQDRTNVIPALRLNFTNSNIEELGEGITRLAKVIKKHCK
jgi:2-aminoadipate transaminase